MGNITLSIPENIHKDMKNYSEIKWSEVVRKAIVKKLEILHFSEKLAKKSKLTKKDIEDFNKILKGEATRKFLI